MVGRAAKASCDDLLLALVCEASIAKGGLFGIQLGLEVVALGQGILEGVLLGQIVDLDQQLPLFDLLPQSHVQFLDLARHLGAHAHLLARLQGAVRHDELLQIPGLGTGGDVVAGGCLGLGAPGQQQGEGAQGQQPEETRGERGHDNLYPE